MRFIVLLITALVISACSGAVPPDTFVTCVHDAAETPTTGKGCGA